MKDFGEGAKETADPSVVYLGKRVSAFNCDNLKPEAADTRIMAHFNISKLEGSSWYMVEKSDLKAFSKDQKGFSLLRGVR